ncbi:MAG: sigma-54-dependent Fis family transcriptional regulator, partial [Gammaproteobacteria bacterium]|nr:sigma-54-dependent Fis family transcriptional regulator [Gammaproteobacteria bacterium]
MSRQHDPADEVTEPAPLQQPRGRGQRRSASILIVDDEPGICNFLQRALAKEYALVETAESVEVAEELCERCHFDLFIVDIRLPGCSGIEWLQSLREQRVRSDMIFMTAYGDLDTAVTALRAGASDFLLKPFRMEQMLTAVRRCLEEKQLRRENFVLRRQVDHQYAIKGVIGHSPAIKEVCQVIQRVAPTPATVLIEGESGTGKELAAHVMHKLSERSGAFVPVNCAAMSPELMESELFGHTKGAF